MLATISPLQKDALTTHYTLLFAKQVHLFLLYSLYEDQWTLHMFAGQQARPALRFVG